jgi:hypothetical protein
MVMDYQMISVDDHVDLQYSPRDLWTSRLPAHLRERGQHVEETGSDNPTALYRLEDRSTNGVAPQSAGARR